MFDSRDSLALLVRRVMGMACTSSTSGIVCFRIRTDRLAGFSMTVE
ncbi:hypothetical protein M758_8G039700 [Ceratodon purpureus]|nr:hypothetical protein M758_8G039700 [Ceratodon purpureus]